MNDDEMEQIAARLGERAAASLDVERTARAVVARLRSRPVMAWWSSPTLLRLAAAVTLTVGAGLYASRTAFHHVPSRNETASQPAPQLQTLSRDELEEVFDSLSADVPYEEAMPGLHNLNTEQLNELLHHMEA